MNVLLVEDSDLDAKLIVDLYLINTDVKVDRVRYLKEALATTKQYDAILLDLRLPNSQGAKTVKHVHDRFPDIPIVAITGDDQRDTILKACENGARDFIIKHKMTRDGLLKVLHECLETVRSWRTIRGAERSLSLLRVR